MRSGPKRGGRGHWRRDLAVGIVPLLVVASATRWFLGLPPAYLAASLTLYAVQVALVLWNAPDGLPGPGLGPANRITLLRSTLVLPVMAVAGRPAALDDDARWWIMGVCSITIALDGVDGWVARRTGTSSAFGARWDMELDSFLLMGLSVLVWMDGKVGAWVLLIGTLRYLFVGAGWIWPFLREELPESARRKTACVIQGVGLLVCLGPIIEAELAFLAAAGALGVLVHSFLVDVLWLARAAESG